MHTQMCITFGSICTNIMISYNSGSTVLSRSLQSMPVWQHRAHMHAVPVDTRALDAQQNAEVDTGPARIWLTTVTALVIPRNALHSL